MRAEIATFANWPQGCGKRFWPVWPPLWCLWWDFATSMQFTVLGQGAGTYVHYFQQFMLSTDVLFSFLKVVVFVLLGIVNAWVYVMAADRARLVMRKPSVLRAATRAGAAFLIGAGFVSVFARRAAG